MMNKRVLHYISVVLLVVIPGLIMAFPRIAEAKDTVVIGIQDNTTSLDPAKAYEHVSMKIIDLTYDRLVTYKKGNFTQVSPDLAESWNITEDGKTWIFHLRKGVKFASGNPVNADAVVFSLRRVVTLAGTPSWLLTQFGITEESITKIDNYTVQINLDQQYAPGLFLSCMAFPPANILDPQVVMEHEQNGDMGSAWLEEHSVGSGPYILEECKRTPPTQYVLKANEYYWGEKPVVKKIIIKGIQEPFEQATMLKAGEIDIAWHLQSDKIQEFIENPDIQIAETLTLSIMSAYMNLGYEPLAKPEVRKAIRYAVDYDGIVDFVLQGAAIKTQTFIPKGFLGYDPTLPYSHDIEKAKQLLTEAGYPDGFDVELKCPDYTPWVDIATKIRSDLAELGIKAKVMSMSPKHLYEAIKVRDFQIYMWEWLTDYLDPDSNAKGFAHCDRAGDDATIKLLAWRTNYVNLETSKLVEQAARELDTQKRIEMYKKITDIIRDEGPYVFLYSPIKLYGIRSEVADLVITPPVSYGDFPVLR